MTQDLGMTTIEGQSTTYPTLTGLLVTAGDKWGPVRVARAANALAQIEDDDLDSLPSSESCGSWVKSYIGSQKVRVYR